MSKRKTKINDKYFQDIKLSKKDKLKDDIFVLTKTRNDYIQERTTKVREVRELKKAIYNLTLKVNKTDEKINDKLIKYTNKI